MNERQCDFEILDPVPWTQVFSASEIIQSKNQATGSNACFDSTQIGHFDSTKLQSPCNDECGRIWCGSTTSAWVISTLFFFVSLAVLLASHFIDVKKKKEKATTNTSTLVDIDGKGRIHSSIAKNELVADGTYTAIDQENPSSQIPSGSQESANVLPPPPSKKEYLKSLGVARLLASQHIVIGHLYAKGATRNTYFFSFGFTWVPWFFILSGYVLTHARLNSSNPTKIDGPYKHIAKRLSTIYPMYAFGIVLSVIIRLFKSSKLPGVDVLIAQSFLLQSWVPVWTEKTLLSQCWFLSNLVVYWACFSLLFKLLHKLTLNQTCGLLLLICCLPWLVVIVPAIDSSIDMDWYSMHQFGQADSADDIWTVLLKFHPIFYLHVFVFGMLLSVLREHLKQNETEKIARVLRSVTRFGACIGYIGLILIFSIQEIKPPARKLSTRLSILLPLQGLMMLGLSPLPQTHEKKWLGQDPLALLFSYAPTWVGDVVRFLIFSTCLIFKSNLTTLSL
jgi:peptidoglycan/LPS O-acetylase OafA/YrhL